MRLPHPRDPLSAEFTEIRSQCVRWLHAASKSASRRFMSRHRWAGHRLADLETATKEETMQTRRKAMKTIGGAVLLPAVATGIGTACHRAGGQDRAACRPERLGGGLRSRLGRRARGLLPGGRHQDRAQDLCQWPLRPARHQQPRCRDGRHRAVHAVRRARRRRPHRHVGDQGQCADHRQEAVQVGQGPRRQEGRHARHRHHPRRRARLHPAVAGPQVRARTGQDHRRRHHDPEGRGRSLHRLGAGVGRRRRAGARPAALHPAHAADPELRKPAARLHAHLRQDRTRDRAEVRAGDAARHRVDQGQRQAEDRRAGGQEDERSEVSCR